MTEFTKLKITFALALLGTLFALHPLLDRFADSGFLYLGYNLKVFYVYSLTSGLLSLCVYLYAVTLLNDRPHSWCEQTGNSTYALAILIVPIYAGLYLSAKLAEQVAVSHVAWAAPAVALGLGVGWVVLSQIVAWRIRRRLGEQDRVSKMAQLANQEIESLNRAKELFDSQHYDLSVVEAWRALEARLRQVLLNRGIVTDAADSQAVIHVAVKKGILQGADPRPGRRVEAALDGRGEHRAAVPGRGERVAECRAAHPLDHPGQGARGGPGRSTQAGSRSVPLSMLEACRFKSIEHRSQPDRGSPPDEDIVRLSFLRRGRVRGRLRRRKAGAVQALRASLQDPDPRRARARTRLRGLLAGRAG